MDLRVQKTRKGNAHRNAFRCLFVISLLCGISDALAEIDAFCHIFYADLVKGSRSPSYIWKLDKPEVALANSRPPIPLHNLPESTAAMELHWQKFPAGTPVRIAGMEGIPAELHIRSGNSVIVKIAEDPSVYFSRRLPRESFAIFTQGGSKYPIFLSNRNGVVLQHVWLPLDTPGLSAAFEARADKTLNTFAQSGFLWEKKKLAGKEFFVNVKGFPLETHMQNGSAPWNFGIQIEGADNIVFSKSKADDTWKYLHATSLDRVQILGPPRPSSAQFRAQFPHDLSRMDEPHTILRFGGKDYLVAGYQEDKGIVTLEREIAQLVEGSPLVSSSELPANARLRLLDLLRPEPPTIELQGKIYRIDLQKSGPQKLLLVLLDAEKKDLVPRVERELPITLSKNLHFNLHRYTGPAGAQSHPLMPGTLALEDLKPGMLVDGLEFGLPYEVRAIPEHEQGLVYLRRVEQVQISWEEFSASLRDPANLIHSPAAQPLAAAAAEPPPKPGLLSRLLRWPFSKAAARQNIPLVGSENVHFLSLERIARSMDFYNTKPEIDIRAVFRKLRAGQYPVGTKINILIDGKEEILTVGRDSSYYAGMAFGKFIADPEAALDSGKIKSLKLTIPGQNLPLEIESDIAEGAFGKYITKFFDNSPVEAVEMRFSISVPNGKTEVAVRYPLRDPNTLRAPRSQKEIEAFLRQEASALLAQLPVAHADAPGLLLFDEGKYFRSPSTIGLASERNLPKGGAIEIIGAALELDFSARVSALWHEVGHLIAQKLWRANMVPSAEWIRALALDGKFVSGYSMSQRISPLANFPAQMVEDFAETVSAYIASDGGRLRPELRKNFAHRFALLDRIFRVPQNRELLENTLAATAQSRQLGIQHLAMGGGAIGLYVYSTRNQSGSHRSP